MVTGGHVLAHDPGLGQDQGHVDTGGHPEANPGPEAVPEVGQGPGANQDLGAGVDPSPDPAARREVGAGVAAEAKVPENPQRVAAEVKAQTGSLEAVLRPRTGRTLPRTEFSEFCFCFVFRTGAVELFQML